MKLFLGKKPCSKVDECLLYYDHETIIYSCLDFPVAILGSNHCPFL